ncbi:MAG TPA: cytidylate kinase-like family protein [Longimicrobiales bacterium]|jgi:hypothetical protein
MKGGTEAGAVAQLPAGESREAWGELPDPHQETAQIVCISRGSLSRGRELAEAFGRKLGYPILSREDLIEAATREGIQVGKLETSMMKPRAFTERLARERDHYLAFSTAFLCDRLLEGPLVYHGRTGHLLLGGVSHVLRVRVVADEEHRIRSAMQTLGLNRTQARRYLSEVEEDRRNWVKAMYGVSWEDVSQYDVIVNVERMNAGNAASALVAMSRLPDFQVTPASRRALDDLHLTARARLALARDPRTGGYGLSVTAHGGAVYVTYLPHDMEVAEDIVRVLEEVGGVRQVRATVAATSILWVQEVFDPASETFKEIVEIARKWSAAVDLVRYSPCEGDGVETRVEELTSPPRGRVESGIEEDQEEPADDGGLRSTVDALALEGRSGGGRSVHGERSGLVTSCCGSARRSLVVLGDLFLGKDPGAKQRMTRELRESIASRMRVPVVTADELRSHYLFGGADILRLVGYLALVVAMFAAVMMNQVTVLRFLSGELFGTGALRMYVAAVAVFLFVPIIAHSYGSVAKALMKLMKME